MQLVKEMTYLLEVRGPAKPADGSTPNPRRLFWEMIEATLSGPRIQASSDMPGIDWFTPIDEGFGRPHVRLPMRTDDGALLLMEYTGLVQSTVAFAKAVEENRATEWEDQYMRMVMTFDTTSVKYRWMTQSLFLARGRLRGAKSLEYEVHRIL